VTILETPGEVADALAERVRREFRERGSLDLALPGGSVAGTLVPRLAALGLDWARVNLYWVDERAVPPGHADSNFRLAGPLVALLPARNVHRMEADLPDLEAAAAAYERILPALDLAILGVGSDGHVASLFPGHPLLREERRRVAPVLDSPKPPRRRITLTLPALRGARSLVVAATGAAKAEAVRARDPALPVALVADRADFYLDAAAASLLSPPPP
jgi:6-phosphogluconolactonase